MKNVHYVKYFALVPLVLLMLAIGHSVNAQGMNTIEGLIYDENGKPVERANVELLDSMDSMQAATQSTSQGKYTFRGMPRGQYTVVVKPINSILLPASKTITIYDSTGRSEYFNLDFTLKVNKTLIPRLPVKSETVYAQEEVPDAARKLFESGKEKFAENDEKGFEDLESAIKIFPTYFAALRQAGTEYVVRGKMEQGYPHLLKAIDVYDKCGECFYSLALAFSGLKQEAAALTASQAAVSLLPTSPYVNLLYGMSLRKNQKYEEAKETLLKARTLFEEPNAEVSWQLSLVYNRLNQNDKAADELETYLKLSPDLKKADKKNVKSLIEKMRSSKSKN